MKEILTNLRTTSYHLQSIGIVCGIGRYISRVKVASRYRKRDTRISSRWLGSVIGWKGYRSWRVGHTTRSKRMVLAIIGSRRWG